jgi:hypothetical protein
VVKVSQSQPEEFAPPEASSIKQYQPEQRILASKRGAVAGSEMPSFGQKLGDFALPKDVGLARLVRNGELQGIRQEASGFGPPAIQAKIAHDAHPVPSDASGQLCPRRDPPLKSLRTQVLSGRAEELVEMSQHIALHPVCSTQRLLQGQIPDYHGGED